MHACAWDQGQLRPPSGPAETGPGAACLVLENDKRQAAIQVCLSTYNLALQHCGSRFPAIELDKKKCSVPDIRRPFLVVGYYGCRISMMKTFGIRYPSRSSSAQVTRRYNVVIQVQRNTVKMTKAESTWVLALPSVAASSAAILSASAV